MRNKGIDNHQTLTMENLRVRQCLRLGEREKNIDAEGI